MKGKEHKELWKFYREMAFFVESRNLRQCKLHHQKLLNEFQSIPSIHSALTEKYPQIRSKLEPLDELYCEFQTKMIEKRRIEA